MAQDRGRPASVAMSERWAIHVQGVALAAVEELIDDVAVLDGRVPQWSVVAEYSGETSERQALRAPLTLAQRSYMG